MKLVALIFTGISTFFFYSRATAGMPASSYAQDDSIPVQQAKLLSDQIKSKSNEMDSMADLIKKEIGKLSESKNATAGILQQVNQLEQKKTRLSELETKELENLLRKRSESEKQIRIIEQSLATMVLTKDSALKEINKLEQQLVKFEKQKTEQRNDSGIVLQYSRLRFLLLNNALLRTEISEQEKQILAFYENRYIADSSFRLLVNKASMQFRQRPVKNIESVEEVQRALDEGKEEFRQLFKLIAAHYEKQTR